MSHTRWFMTLILLFLWPLVAWSQPGSALNRHAHSIINPLEFGSGCTSTTLSAAISSASVRQRALTLTTMDRSGATCTWTLTSNVTVPETIMLDPPMGVIINIAAGITLTINGPFAPHPMHRALFTGAGAVVFGPRSGVTHVPVEWFGAVGDGSCSGALTGTDNTPALQRAIAAAPSGSGIAVSYGSGCYYHATAPTLQERLHLTGAPIPALHLGGGTEKPKITYGGTGVFLNITGAMPYVSISHLTLLGNNTAGTTGIRCNSNLCRLQDLIIEGFTGGGSFGLHIEGTGVGVGEALYFRGEYLDIRSNQTGVLIDGAPTNVISFDKVRLSGNAGDGLRINNGQQIELRAATMEGNCTSGGACYDLNIISGRWIYVYSWLENTTVTRTLFLPTCNPASANYLYIYGYASVSTNVRTALEGAATAGCTYHMDTPWAFVQAEPAYTSSLTVNNLGVYAGNSGRKPALQWVRGHLVLGTQSIDTTRIALRGQPSVADNATVDLSATLTEASPLNGELWVWIGTDNAICKFKIVNDGATEKEDIDGMCTTILATAGAVNVANNGSVLTLENKRGGVRNFGLHFIGAP